jgi:hypothetical protein
LLGKEFFMSEATLAKTKKILVAVLVVGAVAGGTVGAVIANSPSHKVHTTTNSGQQITEIGYRGQNGVNALTLLERHAQVQTKHYSFGDFVTSIDGVPGNGPKYWTFYVNGRQASVGAGAYISKNSDKIDWKLQ